MTAKKFIVAAALLLSATPALAQSAWTTGTEASRVTAGYPSPYGQDLYAYAPGVDARPHATSHSGRNAYAQLPSLSWSSGPNGGSVGYNLRR
ncbi:MAG TPA: hypothetical protein VGJ20_20225 [Xanthobacteraceae bacterium]